MRTHRWIPTLAILSALSLAACDTGAGDDAEGTEVGGTQVQEGDAGVSSNSDGRSVSGSESAQEQGTALNDTTPARPGSPATP
jgi:predicted small secreted protein